MVFKHIFGQEKNKDILIAMLNSVLVNQLHKPIVEVTFLKTVQDPDIAYKKQSIVDVLCQDQDGCQYIIEMQVSARKGFEKRAQYYAAKAYIDQAGEGQPYHDLKEVIFLAFTDYVLFPDTQDYKSEHITLNKKTLQHKLKAFTFTFVELPKFLAQCPKDISKLSLAEKFYYFLCCAQQMSDHDLDALAGEDIVVRKIFQAADRYNWSAEEVRTYDQAIKNKKDEIAILLAAQEKGEQIGREKGRVEGRAKGREEGRAQGREEGKHLLLHELLASGKISTSTFDELIKQ